MATTEYERKIALLKKERWLQCVRAAEIEADRQADSIISEKRINPLNDTLYRPYIPPKPEYIHTDTSTFNSKQSVKPLLDTLKSKR